MRTHRTLLAVGELFDLVLRARGPCDPRPLLERLCDLEECLHALDDGRDDRLRLMDALHAWRCADQVLEELRAGSRWSLPELERARQLLTRVGRYVCDELHRLDDATRD